MPSRSNLIATTFNFDKISTTFMNLLVTNVVITMMRLVSSRSSGGGPRSVRSSLTSRPRQPVSDFFSCPTSHIVEVTASHHGGNRTPIAHALGAPDAGDAPGVVDRDAADGVGWRAGRWLRWVLTIARSRRGIRTVRLGPRVLRDGIRSAPACRLSAATHAASRCAPDGVGATAPPNIMIAPLTHECPSPPRPAPLLCARRYVSH